MVVELQTGVLGHSSTRRLDRAGWRVDTGAIAKGGAVVLASI